MSDQAEDYDSQYTESSSASESTLHDILYRPVETRAQANAMQNVVYIIGATASMNSLKNSSSAFATPPVPLGSVPIKTDNEPYPTNPPSTSRSSTPTSNSGSSLIITVVTLFFERILRGHDAQKPLPIFKPLDITPTVAVKQVPPSEYPQTTTAQSKLFSELKFRDNITTNRDTLKCVKILLAECSLLSFVDGSRNKPIYSYENVHSRLDQKELYLDYFSAQR
jgi:hypothetical protein